MEPRVQAAGSLHFPPISAFAKKWGAIVRKWVYTLSGPDPQSQFSGQGRRKTMFSHRSRILVVTAGAALIVSVHSIRAADFAGSVQGVVKSASGQALPGAYVKLINP